MGLTERHWFESEEPELTDQQLEDAVSIQDRAYRRGYHKGYSDGAKEQKEKIEHLNNITLEYEKEVSRLQDIVVKYERLLEEMLNYQQQAYVNLEQQRAIQALRYKIFKDGGDVP